MLISAVLFAICVSLNAYLAISRGNGMNMAAAVVFLAAAAVWASRWRRAKQEGKPSAVCLPDDGRPETETARAWPLGGLWGR